MKIYGIQYEFTDLELFDHTAIILSELYESQKDAEDALRTTFCKHLTEAHAARKPSRADFARIETDEYRKTWTIREFKLKQK